MNNQEQNRIFNNACSNAKLNKKQKQGFSKWFHNNFQKYERESMDYARIYSEAAVWKNLHGSGHEYQ